MIKTIKLIFLAGSIGCFLTACSPEVGSKEWCTALKEKPKGDWSLNEASDYTKHCLLN